MDGLKSFSISHSDVRRAIVTAAMPVIIDVGRNAAFATDDLINRRCDPITFPGRYRHALFIALLAFAGAAWGQGSASEQGPHRLSLPAPAP